MRKSTHYILLILAEATFRRRENIGSFFNENLPSLRPKIINRVFINSETLLNTAYYR